MRSFFLALGLFGFVSSALASVDASHFVNWLNKAYQHQNNIPPAVKAKATQFRYVLINGFLNERKVNTYADNAARLRELGVPKGQIHWLNPSSLYSIEQNVDWMLDQMQTLRRHGTQKLVLVAHSKGATEALASALAAPSELLDGVEAIFLLQGPFHGTPLADFLTGEPIPLDDRLPFPIRYLLQSIHDSGFADRIRLLEDQMQIKFDRGGLSLTTKATAEFWPRHLQRFPANVARLKSRVFYIGGHQAVADLPLYFKPTGYYMQTYFGDNDGVVPLSSQWLDQVGTPLVKITMDHGRPVSANPRTTSAIGLRHALTEAIFEAAGSLD